MEIIHGETASVTTIAVVCNHPGCKENRNLSIEKHSHLDSLEVK
jgi:hypothetical protein